MMASEQPAKSACKHCNHETLHLSEERAPAPMGQKGSKVEVNESCLKPHHPHKCSDVDLRKLKALIKQGKLAPCFPPEEEENEEVILQSGCSKSLTRDAVTYVDVSIIGVYFLKVYPPRSPARLSKNSGTH